MNIELKPIGYVSSTYQDVKIPSSDKQVAIIEISEDFQDALLNIELNSHLWILSWFHKSRRDVFQVEPKRIDPELPKFGVFALRSPYRPNPIGLSLVKLLKVDGIKLHVQNYDAVDGTPVLDIKPYFENDSIFSPLTPAIFPANHDMKLEKLISMAVEHHQEECLGAIVAVKMALIASNRFGILTANNLKIAISGSACLVDALQGITRARIANPERLSYRISEDVLMSTWTDGNEILVIRLKPDYLDSSFAELLKLSEHDIFEIE